MLSMITTLPPFGLSALLAVTAFAATALLTAFLTRALTRQQIFDTPNERSMHTAKVPRGGGLAVVTVLGFGITFLLYITRFSAPREIWLVPALLPLVAVSWLDDRRGAGIGVRLGAQFAAALLGLLALPPDVLILQGHLPLVVERGLIVISWVWFMNLYNFMDGIDGITGIETIVIALGAGLLLSLPDMRDHIFALGLAGLLVGAAGGFLLLNAHPAKIFLGDVGSVPLGFLTGWLLVLLAMHGMLIAALILPLYYLADSGITIGKRILRKEKFWHPHRQHFYQRAALTLGSHAPVVIWIGLTGLALILTALTSVLMPWPALIAAFAFVGLLLALLQNTAIAK